MGYSCGYCGRDYKTPVERGKCEVSCEAEKIKQDEVNKAKKLNEEKSKMFNEIQDDASKLADKVLTYENKFNTKYYANSFPIVFEVEHNGDTIAEFISQMERYVKNNRHAG